MTSTDIYELSHSRKNWFARGSFSLKEKILVKILSKVAVNSVIRFHWCPIEELLCEQTGATDKGKGESEG